MSNPVYLAVDVPTLDGALISGTTAGACAPLFFLSPS